MSERRRLEHCKRKNLISKHHQTPVCFPAQRTSDTLCSITDSVETKEFRLSYPVCIPKVFQTSLQDPAFRVLIWHPGCRRLSCKEQLRGRSYVPEHDDSTTIVVVEVDSLGHLPTRDGEQDGSAAVVTCLPKNDEWGSVQ
jgi:hypothetical protein